MLNLMLMLYALTLSPIDNPVVTMDTLGFQSISCQIVNGDTVANTYILWIQRISSPSDLSISQCFGGMCHNTDTDTISMAANETDTILLDFYGGSDTGNIQIYYTAYDVKNTFKRDSFLITGYVPVQEDRQKPGPNSDVWYNNGYLFGGNMKSLFIFDINGREVISENLTPGTSRVKMPASLHRGVYIAMIETPGGIRLLKFAKEK